MDRSNPIISILPAERLLMVPYRRPSGSNNPPPAFHHDVSPGPEAGLAQACCTVSDPPHNPKLNNHQ